MATTTTYLRTYLSYLPYLRQLNETLETPMTLMMLRDAGMCLQREAGAYSNIVSLESAS